MAHGCGVHGHSWGAFCGGVEADAHVLVWGAASFCASAPPSSAASRADGASALRPPEPAYGAAGSGDPQAGAGPVGHLNWGGGGRAEEEEEQGARRDSRGGMAVVRGRYGHYGR